MTKGIEKKDDKGKGISVGKGENFSEWYTEVLQKCELGDIRYNVKGFLVFQPWSVYSMEKMYYFLEKALQRKGHKPYFYPTVIPERNFKKEGEHVKGFVPEVFWITEAGEDKLDEKLALRPTSETAFYQMFGLWIRSYKDLPFKTYQRANVFRYETKATRPFLRSREFHWIEAHDAHATLEDAEKQVKEDMETTKEVLHDVFGLPFIFFERPSWDKFPGALRTFAADVLNPDGRVVQQPSTHLLNQSFAKAFDVKFLTEDNNQEFVWATSWGVSTRLIGGLIMTHSDDEGLVLPPNLAPIQVVIIPIPKPSPEIDEVVHKIMKNLKAKGITVQYDQDMKNRPGFKFAEHEMKGIPVRLAIGQRDLEKNEIEVARRDTREKFTANLDGIEETVAQLLLDIQENLFQRAKSFRSQKTTKVDTFDDFKALIESDIPGFISAHWDGTSETEIAIKEITKATIRCVPFDQEEEAGICIYSGKPSTKRVLFAKSY
jgi:prolyl-tRNA synthetase